jgi:uncharacterized protein (DUF2267 family)
VSIEETAANDDPRATLEAMRDKLSGLIEAAAPNVAAQVAGQLRAVLADLEAFDGTAPRRRSCLVLIRTTLAAALDVVENVAVAAQLSGQLRLTLGDLGALPTEETSRADELFAARVARRAKAIAPLPAARPQRVKRPRGD